MCSTGHTSIHDEDGEESQGEKQHKTKGSSSVVVHVLCCTPYIACGLCHKCTFATHWLFWTPT